MEIISIIFSIPILLLFCWGLGALLEIIIPDLKQNAVEQIIKGFIILVLVGLMSKL